MSLQHVAKRLISLTVLAILVGLLISFIVISSKIVRLSIGASKEYGFVSVGAVDFSKLYACGVIADLFASSPGKSLERCFDDLLGKDSIQGGERLFLEFMKISTVREVTGGLPPQTSVAMLVGLMSGISEAKLASDAASQWKRFSAIHALAHFLAVDLEYDKKRNAREVDRAIMDASLNAFATSFPQRIVPLARGQSLADPYFVWMDGYSSLLLLLKNADVKACRDAPRTASTFESYREKLENVYSTAQGIPGLADALDSARRQQTKTPSWTVFYDKFCNNEGV